MQLGRLVTCILAGTASTVAAQTATWLADVQSINGDAIIDPSLGEDSVVVTLSIDMDPGPDDDPNVIGFAGTVFDTLNSLNGANGVLSGWMVLNDLEDVIGFDTTVPDDPANPIELYNTNAGQLLSFGPFTNDNPIDVFQFTWSTTDFASQYSVEYVTSSLGIKVWMEGTPHDFSVDYAVVEGLATWTVLPAPGTALLLVGAAAMRRRRPKRSWLDGA